jgi:tight adherence protein B
MFLIPVASSLMMGTALVLLVAALVPLWDRVTARYVADLSDHLTSLSIDRRYLPVYLRWWGVAIVGGTLIILFGLRMPPVAVVYAYLVYVAPRIVLQMMISARETKLRDQMVGATIALANACRAGLSLAEGLETTSRETPQPLSNELRKIVYDYQHGRTLDEAMVDTKERLDIDSFTLFATAIVICRQRGGNVTEALERISTSLQENQRVERKIAAETASGKSVVFILAISPFVFLLLFSMMHPEGTSLVFFSTLGQVVLAIIIVLVYISVRWSGRILDIEV